MQKKQKLQEGIKENENKNRRVYVLIQVQLVRCHRKTKKKNELTSG
jgi:hypothetical protein